MMPPPYVSVDMGKAKWAYIQPASLAIAGGAAGGTMIMCVAAKKHVTFFSRSRRAPGAGSPEIKARFAAAAAKTKGISSRMERNLIISRAMGGKR